MSTPQRVSLYDTPEWQEITAAALEYQAAKDQWKRGFMGWALMPSPRPDLPSTAPLDKAQGQWVQALITYGEQRAR